jgi:hypothetical protein
VRSGQLQEKKRNIPLSRSPMSWESSESEHTVEGTRGRLKGPYLAFSTSDEGGLRWGEAERAEVVGRHIVVQPL